MPFIRVRDKRTGHEFDLNPERLAVHPEDFVVFDDNEVLAPRPAEPGKKRKSRATTKTHVGIKKE
jgi:hypothetical protein